MREPASHLYLPHFVGWPTKKTRCRAQESPTRRLRAQGIEVEFTEGAVGLIAEEGFDPEFGARGPRGVRYSGGWTTSWPAWTSEAPWMPATGWLSALMAKPALTFEVGAGEAGAETPGEGE